MGLPQWSMPGGDGTSSGVRKWCWNTDSCRGLLWLCVRVCPWTGSLSAASWQLKLEVEVGGVGWPRGSEVQGPVRAREARPGSVPPFSGDVVRMTGSLLWCWSSGVAAACKTNLVLWMHWSWSHWEKTPTRRRETREGVCGSKQQTLGGRDGSDAEFEKCKEENTNERKAWRRQRREGRERKRRC